MSQTLSYCVFLFFPLWMHCCPLGFICSDCFYWNPRVHRIVVMDLLVNFWCFSPLRPIINSIARFPYSCHCFIPLLYSGISTLVVSKSSLMMCNSYLVQFLKTHVSLAMSSHSLICQEGKTCLFKSIMFYSCCLVIAFGILINTNKHIEIMLFSAWLSEAFKIHSFPFSTRSSIVNIQVVSKTNLWFVQFISCLVLKGHIILTISISTFKY